MNTTTIFSLLLVSACLFNNKIIAQTPSPISLEDIYVHHKYSVKSVPGFNTMEDGLHYLKIDKIAGKQTINKYALSSEEKVASLYTHQDTTAYLASYKFNKYYNYLLTLSDPQALYRRSVFYTAHVHNINTGSSIPLHNGQQVMHASFNPEGDKIAYIAENNIYLYDIIKNQTLQITHDGAFNKIINGTCDWVYEEEFGFSQAYQWSPDGSYLAYYKFDESKVKEFTMQYFLPKENYPQNYTFKYPKAGEDNSKVSVYTYHIQSALTVKAQIGEDADQYIPRIKWAANDKLCVFRLNRHQNKLDLLYIQPNNGNSTTVYQETNPYYIDIHDNVYFIQQGSKILLTSEQNGYNHLYLHDIKSNKLSPITKGAWDVDEIVSINEQDKKIYFTAGMHTPLERQFYQVSWTSTAVKPILDAAGWHNVTACNGDKFFLVKHQSVSQVPNFRLIDAKGKTVRILEDNKNLSGALANANMGSIEFLQIPNETGETLNAYILKPQNFDNTKRYPVLMYQYSGPGSQQVMNKFQLDHYMWHQYLAQEGYLVVVADGTGTGARGEAFKKKTYLQLGKLESDDQIAVAKWLGELPYVDAQRIGIWGWSYGGFMSSTCLFKAPKVFKAAIAVAPVTNWRLYDNIYTERYMRTPAENPEGYDNNAPEQMAKNLEGNFMLIHGLADDNVHFQNAVVLTDQLLKHKKQFRSEYYPNGNHGIGGGAIRYQLFQRMTDFIKTSL